MIRKKWKVCVANLNRGMYRKFWLRRNAYKHTQELKNTLRGQPIAIWLENTYRMTTQIIAGEEIYKNRPVTELMCEIRKQRYTEIDLLPSHNIHMGVDARDALQNLKKLRGYITQEANAIDIDIQLKSIEILLNTIIASIDDGEYERILLESV